jgi:hypothetical protein
MPAAYACNPCYLGDWDQEDHSPDLPEKNLRPYFQNNQSKEVGSMAQVVE